MSWQKLRCQGEWDTDYCAQKLSIHKKKYSISFNSFSCSSLFYQFSFFLTNRDTQRKKKTKRGNDLPLAISEWLWPNDLALTVVSEMIRQWRTGGEEADRQIACPFICLSVPILNNSFTVSVILKILLLKEIVFSRVHVTLHLAVSVGR